MNRPLTIYLADLTYTTISLATEAFPLNIGFVGSYAKARFGKDVDLRFFKYIDDLEDALYDSPPDILGMSNYPWNYKLGIEFFRMLNTMAPDAIRVMGGPNIPLEDKGRDRFILNNPEIDFYAYLEGEEAFSNLVEHVLEVGLERKKLKQSPVGGMIHLGEGGLLHKGIFLPRRKVLDDIPSPYLTGIMDKFFDGKLSPMLETSRGCPFPCTYCHEGSSLISKVNFFSVDRVKAELDYVASKAPSNLHYLMFADPNFAMYERDYEICEHIARIQERTGYPKSIFASTGKNKKERILRALKRLNGTMNLWMSVQSMDMKVLENIKRQNINLDSMMSLSTVYKEVGVPSYSEIILGLPGEDYDSHMTSIAKVVDAGIDSIATYSLMLLNGTELNSDESREKFGIKSHFRVIQRDFGRLRNGTIVVEVEEIATSTNSMSFDDYKNLRYLHLIVNIVYNGKVFAPLFKFLKQQNISVFELLKFLTEHIVLAPQNVQDLCASFAKQTAEELWDSEDELRTFMAKEENYLKLTRGELGHNLIMTHLAASTRNMGDWATFVFLAAEKIFKDKGVSPEFLGQMRDLERFCKARVHNLWASERGSDNPLATLQHDICAWDHPKVEAPLADFCLPSPLTYRFEFFPEKIKEIDDYVTRYGTSNSGLGRILVATSLGIRQKIEPIGTVH